MATRSVPEGDWSNECWQWRMVLRQTQAAIAEYAFVSPASWSRWERGVCEPPAYVKARIRKVLDELYVLMRAEPVGRQDD